MQANTEFRDAHATEIKMLKEQHASEIKALKEEHLAKIREFEQRESNLRDKLANFARIMEGLLGICKDFMPISGNFRTPFGLPELPQLPPLGQPGALARLLSPAAGRR